METGQFETAAERHRAELRVHCYRMLGSFDEAEDLVQETLLRAWKHRDGFEGRSTLRAWLYKIATNACLDALEGRDRRLLPYHRTPPSSPTADFPPTADVPWLQPFPDRLLPADEEPEAVAVRNETLQLAFLAAIQHLPPRQRAVLILRDVLGWPAKDTATLLDGTVAATNSALQRARATLREHLPERRLDWAPTASPEELAVVRRYMDAVEGSDLSAVAALLAEDVRATMPPFPLWFAGRESVLDALRLSWNPDLPGYVGRFRVVPTRANGGPAAASYTDGKPFAIGLFRIEDGLIVELTAFHDPGLFPAFGLPMSFPD